MTTKAKIITNLLIEGSQKIDELRTERDALKVANAELTECLRSFVKVYECSTVVTALQRPYSKALTLLAS